MRRQKDVSGVGVVPSSPAGAAPSGDWSDRDTLFGAPQFGQNSSFAGISAPHTEHLTTVAPEAEVATTGPEAVAESGAPQFGQYSVPAGLCVPHTAHVIVPALAAPAPAGAEPLPPAAGVGLSAAAAVAAATSMGEPQLGQ